MAGVQIRVHLTFAALLVLVAWSAAVVGEDVVGAVGWLLLLFTCVVVHELAHPLLPVAPWSGAIVARLVWMNLLLAAFNLVPACPSDGAPMRRWRVSPSRPGSSRPRWWATTCGAGSAPGDDRHRTR
jgi:Zn-dependent protease